VRRSLHRDNQSFPRATALEAAEFIGGDHHDFLLATNGHELRPFTFDAAHELAEPRLGVL
jgi:hypothetical protein